jgi:hypothetical protein
VASTTAPADTRHGAPPSCRRTPAAPGDRAVRVDEQLQRWVVVEDPCPGAFDVPAHRPQVLGAADRAVAPPARLGGRKRQLQLVQFLPGQLEDPGHPGLVGEAPGDPLPFGDGVGAAFGRGQPVADPGGRGDATGAAVALVDEHGRGAGRGRGQRGPRAGQPAADHQHVGVQLEIRHGAQAAERSTPPSTPSHILSRI